MVKMIKTMDKQIISIFYGHDRDWVFTPDHFNYPLVSGYLQSWTSMIDLIPALLEVINM
jgi:hypothetical protein